MSSAPNSSSPLDGEAPRISPWVLASLGLAAAGSVGSVSLSVAMGLKACPLCFYQRTLMFSVLAVLVLAFVADRRRAAFAALLAIPLAVGGLALAGYHEWLVLAGELECPLGLLDLGTAPVQSLAAFVLLTAALLAAAWDWPRGMVAGIVLGVPLAWACIASAPPMPPAPKEPYTQPLEICRPPYVGPTDGI